MTVRFLNQLVAELTQPFWAAWQGGEFMTDASAVAGTHRQHGLAWVRQAGGVCPRRGHGLQGRYLSFTEREEVALGRAGGESIRSISRRWDGPRVDDQPQLARNGDAKGAYRATTAHPQAYERASRPKPAKLVTNLALRVHAGRDRTTHQAGAAGYQPSEHCHQQMRGGKAMRPGVGAGEPAQATQDGPGHERAEKGELCRSIW